MILLSQPGGASIPWSLIGHTVATSGGALPAGPTPAINTAGADLIVAGVSYYSASVQSNVLSDSKSNTWSTVATITNSGASLIQTLFYVHAPAVGAGHTFTFDANAATLCVAVFAGSLAAPLDQHQSSFLNGAQSFQVGAVTPSQANELIVSSVGGGPGSGSGDTPGSIDSSYIITDHTAHVSGGNYGGGLAYLLQGVAAATNPTWSTASLLWNWAGVAASFKRSF